MKDVSQLSNKNIKGIFFDIDDTFSSDGKITPEAYQALWSLKNSGIIVAPITGRPAGWCDHIARMWPVTAVVGENGAFYFMMKNGKIFKNYIWGKDSIEESRVKLELIKTEVLKKIPQADVASDQHYREFDLAIDICEDVSPLSKKEVDEIVSIMKRHGANVKISSIHINCWFGSFDKLSATKMFVKEEYGINLDEHNEEYTFIGDSQNDEPMFCYFKNSVGVANVLAFEGRLKHMPTFITPSKSGAGFVELAKVLLKK